MTSVAIRYFLAYFFFLQRNRERQEKEMERDRFKDIIDVEIDLAYNERKY